MEFDPKVLISDFTFFRFTTFLNKFFSSEFVSNFISAPFLIKSLGPLNEITGISLTIDLESNLLLSLSKSLDQSTGLDASKPLVDSAKFDSSTRLLQFNLKELVGQKKRLERIQNNSLLFERKEYSCDFVAVIETSKYSQLLESFSKLEIAAVIDESLKPKISQTPLKSFPWPIKDDFDLKDQTEILNLFEWIGLALRPQNYKTVADSDEYFLTDTCKSFTIEGQILPHFNHLLSLTKSSTRLIFSLKVCQKIPPPFELNLNRLKHFNERKFDSNVCTADQMALTVFKSPLQTLSFRLNSTA